MSIGVEHNLFIGVPVPSSAQGPPVDSRFQFRELNDGIRIEVRHPFHGTTIIGDRSYFFDPSIDDAAVVLFKETPYLIDSAKLNRPYRFETRPLAGEFSQLSHCFSLGSFAVMFGGGPMDVLDALYNDASHSYNGHQGDDNYQGHGREDLHDRDRASFFQRAGIIDALVEAGSLKRAPSGIFVGNTRLTIETLLSEDEVTVRRSFLSNKHPSRRMDADRFQYSLEESYYLRLAASMGMRDPGRIPRAMAEASINSIARMIIVEESEGDQLVYTDDHVAMSDAIEYCRHNAEHWCEPVQDLVNDILNLAERYFFLCDHPDAKNYQYFYPRDYLHTSSSQMFERFDRVAKDDEVMRWLLDTAESIARDQRQKSLSNIRGDSEYQGPNPPDGVVLRPQKDNEKMKMFEVVNDKFVIKLPKGKVRAINPRVVNGGGIARPLSDIRTDFADYASGSHRWIGDYVAELTIEDPSMALALGAALNMIRDKWPRQLAVRPLMPNGELRRTIDESNRYVLARGKRA